MPAPNSPKTAFRRFISHPVQAVLAYLLFGGLRLLSFRTASALGGWFGRSIGPRLKATARARRNLARIFPEMTAAEQDVIIGGMWDNLGRTAFEYPHLDRLRTGGPDPDVEIAGQENIDLLKNDGKPGIFFTGHLANWEIFGYAASAGGLPVNIVYRAPNNPLVHSLFQHRQPDDGDSIPKGSQGARKALTLLSQGEHLGMAVDQKMNDGIAVPFFGIEAMTAPALAQFALKYDCPVAPFRVERLDGGSLRITFFEPLEIEKSGDRHDDIAAIMTRVNGILEGWIREKPEQWLWLHNRWPD